MNSVDIIIIGGGPVGMSAALVTGRAATMAGIVLELATERWVVTTNG